MPSTTLTFDAAWIFFPGGILLASALGVMGWRLRKRGLSRGETTALLLLRGLAMGVALLLLARPVSVQALSPRVEKVVSLVIDRSLSMSLIEANKTRYQHVLDFLKDKLAHKA